MILVLNSTPLIYLNRVSLSWVFEALEEKFIIPQEVYEEVVNKGKREGKGDANIIEKLIQKDIITINTIKKEITNFSSELHAGEIEVLSLARELDVIAILEDNIARKYGAIMGIEVHGSIYILLLLLKRNILSKEKVVGKLNKMIDNGFFLSPKVYKKTIEMINTI